MSEKDQEVDNSAKILRYLIEKEIGENQTITFQHDLWCASMYQQPCNCSPDVYIEDKFTPYPKGLLS